MKFAKWFEAEGRLMVDAGCSAETVASAAYFVAIEHAAMIAEDLECDNPIIGAPTGYLTGKRMAKDQIATAIRQGGAK